MITTPTIKTSFPKPSEEEMMQSFEDYRDVGSVLLAMQEGDAGRPWSEVQKECRNNRLKNV